MFYNFYAKADKTAELEIYGDIGESWWGESVTAKDVAKKLNDMKDVDTINVRINSFGGSVADGIAIVNALKRHKAKKIVTVDGVAVSAGSLIAMAGDEIHMGVGSMMMIHAPWSGCMGNAQEMREAADVLDKISDAMVGIYVAKTGKSNEEISNLLKDGEDHWYTAEEAVAAGFADKLVGGSTSKASGAKSQMSMAMAAFRGSVVKPNKEVKMSNPENQIDADVQVVDQLPEEPKSEPVAEQSACANCSNSECKGCEGGEATAAVEPSATATIDPQAAITAAVNAAVEAAVAKAKAEAEVLVAQAKAEVEAANAKLALEIEAKELREVQAEVRAKFAFLPNNSDELGSAIKALRKANPEACAKVEAVMAAANALLTDPANAQMSAIGSTQEAAPIDAAAKVELLAKEKLDAKAAKTIEQCRAMVYSENPELQRALRGEE